MRSPRLAILSVFAFCLLFGCSQGQPPAAETSSAAPPDDTTIALAPGGPSEAASEEAADTDVPSDVVINDDETGAEKATKVKDVILRTHSLKIVVTSAFYSFELEADGGSGAYTWSITGLPEGSSYPSQSEGGVIAVRMLPKAADVKIVARVCDRADAARCAQREYELQLAGMVVDGKTPLSIREPMPVRKITLEEDGARLVSIGSDSGEIVSEKLKKPYVVDIACSGNEAVVMEAEAWPAERTADFTVPKFACRDVDELAKLQELPRRQKNELFPKDANEAPLGFAVVGLQKQVLHMGILPINQKEILSLMPLARRVGQFGVDERSTWGGGIVWEDAKERLQFIWDEPLVFCSAGKVLTQFTVDSRGKVAAVCRPVVARDEGKTKLPFLDLFDHTLVTAGEPIGASDSGEKCDSACGDRQVAVGVVTYWNGSRDNSGGEETLDPKYKSVALVCMDDRLLNESVSPLGWIGDAQRWLKHPQEVTGFTESKRCGGSDRHRTVIFAPPGHVVAGIRGTSGDEVDLFGPISRYVYAEAHKLSPRSAKGMVWGGGRGKPFLDLRCPDGSPDGSALTGLTLKVGRRTYTFSSGSCPDCGITCSRVRFK